MNLIDRILCHAFNLADALTVYRGPIKKFGRSFEKRLSAKLAHVHPSTPPPTIDRVSNISDIAFYHDYYLKNKPVILENMFSEWPALNKWKLDFFKQRYGDLVLPVEWQNHPKNTCYIKTVTLKQIIESFSEESQTDYYSKFIPILSLAPELKSDIDLADIRRFARLNNTKKIWVKATLGKENCFTTTHMECVCSFIMQVEGRKEWTIFSPENNPLIYPRILMPFTGGYVSPLFNEHKKRIDYTNYPLAKHLKGSKIVLNAGDLLYLPPLYWHRVRSLSPSVQITCWWPSIKRSFGSSPLFGTLFTYYHLKILLNLVNAEYYFHENTLELNRNKTHLRNS